MHEQVFMCYDIRVFKKLKYSIVTNVTQMKCACESCLCIVSLAAAVLKDKQNYCSEACANGHPNGTGCGHTGCNCCATTQI
jgi:metallothionein